MKLARFMLRGLTVFGSDILAIDKNRCLSNEWRMITLTTNAARKVNALQEENGSQGKRLRIFVESGGCSGFQYGMSFDEMKDGDKVLESEGVSFLIDEASLAYMNGSEIDFDDGLNGKGFEIKNPNAESTCGCGKSFN